MEMRRLQRTGGSTFTLSLPKRWVEANRLGKGDALAISEMDDGALIVEARARPVEELAIEVDAVREAEEHLLRRLVALYIRGYRTITVRSPRGQAVTEGARRAVRRFTRLAMGVEIVDESEGRVVVRDLLNPADLPLLAAVKRMHLLARTMHQDAIRSVLEREEALGREVGQRDSELDRLLWLVERQYYTLLREPTLLKKLGADSEGALTLLLVARYLERIGDHAVKIALGGPRRIGGARVEKILSRTGRLATMSIESLNMAMDSLYRRDLVLANRAIDSDNEALGDFEEVVRLVAGCDGETAVAMGRISESVRRTGMYARDIAECAINLYADRA